MKYLPNFSPSWCTRKMQSCYEIISHVGSGTFGKVFKCRCRSSGRLVALKELVKDKFRELVLQNEVDILRKLCRDGIHENHFIVQTLDIIEEPSRTCLVFELLDRSLYHLMKERKFLPLPLQDIRVIAYQLFSALQRLFELNLLHTDIKPENIMLVDHARWPFRVKMIDFGSASRMRTARIYQAPYIQSRFYRSPEILLGSSFCDAIDMWSVGCVLAEICVGFPLYPGATEYDQVRYIMDLQGEFPLSLLQSGKKTDSYFVRVHRPQCNSNMAHFPGRHGYNQACLCGWRLKTTTEYKNETGREAVESRRVRYFNLSHLAQWRHYRGPPVVPPHDDSLQHCDSLAFANLIQHALSLDPIKRIKPSQALLHNFITASHLSSYDMRSEYIQRTDDASIRAFGIPCINRHNHPPRSLYPPNSSVASQSSSFNAAYTPNTRHGNDFLHNSGPSCSCSSASFGSFHGQNTYQKWLPNVQHHAWLPQPPLYHQTQYDGFDPIQKSNDHQPSSDATTTSNHAHILLTNNHRNSMFDNITKINKSQPVYFPSSEISNINHPFTQNTIHTKFTEKFSQPPEQYDSAVICSVPLYGVNDTSQNDQIQPNEERCWNGNFMADLVKLRTQDSATSEGFTGDNIVNPPPTVTQNFDQPTSSIRLGVPCSHDIANSGNCETLFTTSAVTKRDHQ